MIINTDLIYPIGSIYMSVNSTNPGTLFGGTWTQLQGRFLLGAGSSTDSRGETKSFSVNATGGEFSHQLSVAEMPAHNHPAYICVHYETGGSSFFNFNASGVTNIPPQNGSIATGNTGSSYAHNNMPPYLVVYMWKRTA